MAGWQKREPTRHAHTCTQMHTATTTARTATTTTLIRITMIIRINVGTHTATYIRTCVYRDRGECEYAYEKQEG